MHEQDKCFALPTGEYGACHINATNGVFVMLYAQSEHGLCYQAYGTATVLYFMKASRKIKLLTTFLSYNLVGLLMRNPNAMYKKVYTPLRHHNQHRQCHQCSDLRPVQRTSVGVGCGCQRSEVVSAFTGA